MNKTTTLILGVLFVFIISGMVYAASDKVADKASVIDSAEKTAKNMTYGQCVSENAIIKNSCYASVKDALKICKEQASNQTTKKDALKQCNSAYKTDLKECKTTFKQSKNECKKIKHNFLETIGSSFK